MYYPYRDIWSATRLFAYLVFWITCGIAIPEKFAGNITSMHNLLIIVSIMTVFAGHLLGYALSEANEEGRLTHAWLMKHSNPARVIFYYLPRGIVWLTKYARRRINCACA